MSTCGCEVIRQRMAYEADPDGFAERYADADAELARRIAAARALVDDVVLPDNELRRIAALCAAFDVDGMRADLVVARTAAAHAAWRGALIRRGAGHPGGRRAGAAASAPPRPVRRSRASTATSWTRRWRKPAPRSASPSPTRRAAVSPPMTDMNRRNRIHTQPASRSRPHPARRRRRPSAPER